VPKADTEETELNKQKDRLAAVFVNLMRLLFTLWFEQLALCPCQPELCLYLCNRKGQRREP